MNIDEKSLRLLLKDVEDVDKLIADAQEDQTHKLDEGYVELVDSEKLAAAKAKLDKMKFFIRLWIEN